MPEYDPVTKISIVPRGAAGGLTFFAPSEERLESGLYTRSYLENQMAVALGGRVAEELIYGEDDVTTGASGDFQQVDSLPLTPSLISHTAGLGGDSAVVVCNQPRSKGESKEIPGQNGT